MGGMSITISALEIGDFHVGPRLLGDEMECRWPPPLPSGAGATAAAGTGTGAASEAAEVAIENGPFIVSFPCKNGDCL